MNRLHQRDFLKELDFTPEEWRSLLDLAAELKAATREGREERRLVGRQVALIFEKTSTRTRCAFEVAVADYFRTAELYAEYGAADTEPNTVFALMVKAAVDGDKVTNPRSVRGWELYSTMPGATRAAKALHAAAALVIKAGKADLPAARAFVAAVF